MNLMRFFAGICSLAALTSLVFNPVVGGGRVLLGAVVFVGIVFLGATSDRRAVRGE